MELLRVKLNVRFTYISGLMLLAACVGALCMRQFACAAVCAFGGAGLLACSSRIRDLASGCARLKNLETIVRMTDLIVITTDANGWVNGFNPGASRALGYSPEEVIGQLTPAAFHPNDSLLKGYAEFAREPTRQEWEYIRKDGSTFPAVVTITPIVDDFGNTLGYCGMGLDISVRKQNEQALREKQELIESIAISSPTIFYIFDLEQRQILYSNRPLPQVLGYTDEQCEAMGADPLPNILHPEDLDALFNRYEGCRKLGDGDVYEIEFRCLNANNELRWMYSRDVVFKRDLGGKPIQILANVVDVTEKKRLDEQIESQVLEIQDTNLALEIQTNALEEANAQLEALAFTDGLTGIANHRSFQEELANAFESSRRKKKRLSLMLIDVDRFKQYNDTFGHPSGDIVLKRVAQVIRECCPIGCTPARYGGEEFAVLCPGYAAREVLELAERIRNSIEVTPWPERPLTVSIGAVSLSSEIPNPSDLVTAADNALYSSKASGRNCVTFYDYDNRMAS